MKNFLYVSLLASSLLSASSVYAVEKTTQFEVKLTINESCEFGTASGIDFETFDRSTQATKTTNGTLAVTCTLGTPYKIVLDSNREMANTNDASSVVAYDLFQDSANKIIWGKTVDEAVAETGTGSIQNLTIFAQLRGNTNVKAGNYTDTVTARISY
ncbi:Csu type fimbrial protein [Acinetobacter variabilis]|uniref:Csu type fimbrial protein n=1 Tax=Acinetobacter variabilis TaxID=70346 RepID=UPI001330DF7E|nr:spore coat U domain-containing protein [Acinetobacter variabilis]